MISKVTPAPVFISDDAERTFGPSAGGGYVFALPALGITKTLEHLRRERHELHGELTVHCSMFGARTVGPNILSAGTINLSSVSARVSRARILAARARTGDSIPFEDLLEEFAYLVLDAERDGDPAIDLSLVTPQPASTGGDLIRLDGGLFVARRHSTIPFGMGGVFKSYFALGAVVELARMGLRVGYFDWEMDEYAHHDRLRMLVPSGPIPSIKYVRCRRPLVHELSRLQRIVRQERLDYVVLDSVAYGCAGAPEDSEACMAYFQAVNQLGDHLGTMLLAHVSKPREQGRLSDMKYPFGSIFWHNSARVTWLLHKSQGGPDQRAAQVAFINRKNSFGKEGDVIGRRITFQPATATDGPSVQFGAAGADQMDDDVVTQIPLWKRIHSAVKYTPLTVAEISDQIGHGNVESINRIVRQYKQVFTRVDGTDGVSRVAILERQAS